MTKGLTTTISVGYKSGGYTSEQIDELATLLSAIGPTRTKPFYDIDAVEATLIEFVLSYIGAKLVDVAVVKPSIAIFAKTIKRFRSSKAATDEQEPALLKVVFSFDDLDVVVYHPSQEDLEKMGQTLDLVLERLTTGRLKGLTGVLVEMPLVESNGSWIVPMWRDAIVGGPNTLWAITTAYFQRLDRAPYNAATDEWLSSDAPERTNN